jgi:hypothetical protein
LADISKFYPSPLARYKILISVIYIYVCGKCRTQFMLPMEKSVTFTGACANEIIPSINRSFVYKAKERCHIIIYVLFLCEYWCWTKPMQKIWRDSMIFSLVMDKNGEFAIYRWYNLIRTCAGECDWLFHWQHKLCATFSTNVNKNYRLPIKVYYRICNLRHIRIEINHGSQKVFICFIFVWVLMLDQTYAENMAG